jgi:glutamine cyclotransferase
MARQIKKHWILLSAIFLLSVIAVFVFINSQSNFKPITIRHSDTELTEPVQDEMSNIQSYRIVKTYPHDKGAFTQGLVFHEGYLYESTGLVGQSTLRKTELETGQIVQQHDVPADYFAEGLARWKDSLIQLTWTSGKGFIYDIATFRQIGEFTYDGEGWGITSDGAHLIMSDGTATLRFVDPKTFKVVRKLTVSDQHKPIVYLNELEFIKGEIYANVWLTSYIVRISPETGAVLGWIDLRGLKTQGDVLNGIAYDKATDRLFVTGKHWPNIFEIALVPYNDSP